MTPYYQSENGSLFMGDCLEVMKGLPDNHFSSLITDPPYGLSFMGKKWDYDVPGVEVWEECLRVLKPGGTALIFAGSRTQHRMAVNVEDAGFILKDCIMWIYAQGFPKSHNFGCRCGGNSVPYNHNIDNGDHNEKTKQKAEYNLRFMQKSNLSESLNIKNKQGKVLQSILPKQSPQKHREEGGEPKATKRKQSSLEGWPICGAGKGVCDDKETATSESQAKRLCTRTYSDSRKNTKEAIDSDRGSSSYQQKQRGQQTGKLTNFQEPQRALGKRTFKRCSECGGVKGFEGFGSQLKPSYETVIVAMKKCDGTYAQNALTHGVAGLNIDGSRISVDPNDVNRRPNGSISLKESDSGIFGVGGRNPDIGGDTLDIKKGRFPANVILNEEAAALLDEQSGFSKSDRKRRGQGNGGVFGGGLKSDATNYNDQGHASRFFYTAKSSKSERNMGCEGLEAKFSPTMNDGIGVKEHNPETATKKNNHHPTVKPLSLMKYLCTLTKTPTGGTVLDPFAGSGTTGLACIETGRPYVLIEREAEYCEISKARLEKAERHKLAIGEQTGF